MNIQFGLPIQFALFICFPAKKKLDVILFCFFLACLSFAEEIEHLEHNLEQMTKEIECLQNKQSGLLEQVQQQEEQNKSLKQKQEQQKQNHKDLETELETKNELVKQCKWVLGNHRSYSKVMDCFSDLIYEVKFFM